MNLVNDYFEAKRDFLNRMLHTNEPNIHVAAATLSTINYFESLYNLKELNKLDIISIERASNNSLEKLKVLSEDIIEESLQDLMYIYAFIISELAKECEFFGSKSFTIKLYKQIGNLYLKASGLSKYFNSNSYSNEFKSKAAFWFFKSDQAFLKRPSINQKVFYIGAISESIKKPEIEFENKYSIISDYGRDLFINKTNISFFARPKTIDEQHIEYLIPSFIRNESNSSKTKVGEIIFAKKREKKSIFNKKIFDYNIQLLKTQAEDFNKILSNKTKETIKSKSEYIETILEYQSIDLEEINSPMFLPPTIKSMEEFHKGMIKTLPLK